MCKNYTVIQAQQNIFSDFIIYNCFTNFKFHSLLTNSQLYSQMSGKKYISLLLLLIIGLSLVYCQDTDVEEEWQEAGEPQEESQEFYEDNQGDDALEDDENQQGQQDNGEVAQYNLERSYSGVQRYPISICKKLCPRGYYCQEGQCVRPCPFGRCRKGFTCRNRYCFPTKKQCSLDRDCRLVQSCQLGFCQPTCAATTCDTNTLCVYGSCLQDIRKCRNNRQCRRDEECREGYCINRCFNVFCIGGGCFNGACILPPNDGY